MQNTPFDVYAWKGNYAPYRFNLEDFVPIIAGQRDHIDPSSHLVLSVGAADGANVVELACFAPR
jgi:homogentisate 1,2-dioxygenase